ncbi:hypothetical protein CcCBS67573_g09787 [Chytriomyces confervae]|uniref:Fungal lipase-type domain-containing protein n=1 Tax=Chytriomyces confervae TaxID=246404 RepID=A0A507DMW9_9FUNG|nr:hypothetical protein CcCBS67573_g09787 [Chytriomyces confervae]
MANIAIQTNSAPDQKVPTAPADRCLYCNPAGLTNTEPPVSEWPKIDMQANTVVEHAQDYVTVLGSMKKFVDRLMGCPVSCKLCQKLEIIAFVGRSGVGKSVAINLAAGHEPTVFKSDMGGLLVEFSPLAPSKVYHMNASGTLFPMVHKDTKRIIVDCPGFFENRSPGIEFLQRCVIKKMLESRDVKVVLFKSVGAERDVSFAQLLKSDLMVPGSCLVCFTKASDDTSATWTAGVDPGERPVLSEKFQNAPLQTILLKRPDSFPIDTSRMMKESFVRDLDAALNALNFSPTSVSIKESDAMGIFVNNATAAMVSLLRKVLSERLDKHIKNTQLQPYHIPFLQTLVKYEDQPPIAVLDHLRNFGFFQLPYETDHLVLYSHFWDVLAVSGLHVKGVTSSEVINQEVLSRIQQVIASPEYKIEIDSKLLLPGMLLQWVEIRERFWLEYVAYKGQMFHLMEKALSVGGVRKECSLLVNYRLSRCNSMASAFEVVTNKPRSELNSVVNDTATMIEVLDFDVAIVQVHMATAESVTRSEKALLTESLLIGSDFLAFAAEKTLWGAVSSALQELPMCSVDVIRERCLTAFKIYESSFSARIRMYKKRMTKCRGPLSTVKDCITLSSKIYDHIYQDENSVRNLLQGLDVTFFKLRVIQEKGILYFVAIFHSVAHVVFRGIEPASVRNWETNFSAAKEDFDECSFHPGYLEICQGVIELIRAEISTCTTVVFSGHCLGGALAHTIHAVYLLTEREAEAKSTFSIGFGSPVAFGIETEQFLEENKLSQRFITLVNKGDPVPLAFHDLVTAAGKATLHPTIYGDAGPQAVLKLLIDIANLIETILGHSLVAGSKWLTPNESPPYGVQHNKLLPYLEFTHAYSSA